MRLVLLLFLTLAQLAAHEVSESYLQLEVQEERLRGTWEVALRDLELALGLDGNRDDTLTWNEVLHGRSKIEALVRTALAFPGVAEPASVSRIELAQKMRGNFLAIHFYVPVGRTWRPTLDYRFLFPFDRKHRALVTVNEKSRAKRIAVLTLEHSRYEGEASPRSGFIEFVRQGVVHIWEGSDHILFLLALLLPAVIQRGSEELRCQEAMVRVIKVVTAFTLAHSLTLGAGAMGWIRIPSRVVETVIAFSVLLAATNNITRIWDDRSWLLAFVFGLVHGFGFASVLSELDLSQANLLGSLIGFNAGVEAGQIAIVALFFPIAFLIRESWFYRRVVVVTGSVGIMLVACGWMVERAFSVALFSTISTLLQ